MSINNYARYAYVCTTCTCLFLFLGINSTEAKSLISYSRSYISIQCLPQSLKDTLATIESKFGKVTVISCFRKNAVVKRTGRKSLHASCRAVDFKHSKKNEVHKWLLKNFKGGIGYYTGPCSHLHIDNGGNYRWYSKRC